MATVKRISELTDLGELINAQSIIIIDNGDATGRATLQQISQYIASATAVIYTAGVGVSISDSGEISVNLINDNAATAPADKTRSAQFIDAAHNGLQQQINAKQKQLTAGDNITITAAGVISAEAGEIDIKQTTGQSITAVMSQKATTDALAGKASTADLATKADASALAAKQNAITPGTALYFAGDTLNCNFWRGTQTQWDALSDTDKATYYIALIIE